MKTKLLTIAVALAMLAVPATAMASHANDNGQSHDNFPGLPGAALFGLCTAADNADEDRADEDRNATDDNGNETSSDNWMNAPPFAWLFANEDCEDVQHPSDDKPEQAESAAEQASDEDEDEDADDGQDEGPPEHAGGPPDHAGGPDR